MRSILEALANGNISAEITAPYKNSKYGKASERAADLKQKLLDRLGTEDKDLFETYVDAQGDADAFADAQNFAHGFKLGLLMTAETFMGMDDIYSRE
jgi:hypothetical protein